MKLLKKSIAILAGFGLVIGIVLAVPPAWAWEAQDLSKSDKVFMTNLAGITAITAWGMAKWDYFDTAPKRESEGWFSDGTKEGGADKLGHFYFTYALSHILSSTFDHWSFSREEAGLWGAASSFAMMSYMELGDAFSDYGFSHEDLLMNLAGAATAYLFYTRPRLSEKINFRVEYVPEFDKTDVFTDYENMKFLMAVRMNGFKALKHTPARHFELQLGYYARGYPGEENRERNIYLGVGISLPALFSGLTMKKTAKFFEYFQLPFTYIPVEKDLNR
ncbi:MAG: DUF2279 domain-containing protein [Desulfobacter sp.]|nr:MAG: DUF2279 domain-containing protein [Desulfobacter sp.]